jgi:hypothetical protein
VLLLLLGGHARGVHVEVAVLLLLLMGHDGVHIQVAVLLLLGCVEVNDVVIVRFLLGLRSESMTTRSFCSCWGEVGVDDDEVVLQLLGESMTRRA